MRKSSFFSREKRATLHKTMARAGFVLAMGLDAALADIRSKNDAT
jgi:hypothetical protein